jgi:UDP-glucuronate decarboxylase
MTMWYLENLRADLDEIASRSAKGIEQLLAHGVLVTGGSGFVGRWVISSLAAVAAKNDVPLQLVSINRNTTSWQQSLVEEGLLKVINCDITNEIPDLGEFGYIFHCATPASADLNVSQPAEMERIIAQGAESVIRRFAGTDCRVVNVSSGAVYGIQPPDIRCLDEEWLQDDRYELPDSAYHRGKSGAESRFNSASEGGSFSVVHARLFAFLAPFLPLDTHFAAGNFVRDALLNRPITINGDSRTVRTYMYGTDLVVWLIAAAVRGVSGCAYNVGSPHETTIEGLASIIAQRAGLASGVSQGASHEQSGPPHRYVPCTSRTERELGVNVQVSLADAIDRTLQWCRDDPQRDSALFT